MVAFLERIEYKWRASIIVALGLFLSVLDSTIVSVALPVMRHDFATDFDTITWVVSAYFLAQAAIIPITGYMSDRFGTKSVFVSAMAVFVVGSLLCTLAPTEDTLIGARVIQGLGGGALFPTSFAIAYRAFPRDEWGRATAIIGVPVLLAPTFGPVIGGYLTTLLNWRAIFGINLPLGLIALGLAVVVLHGRAQGDESQVDSGFDVLGLALAVAGFTVLVYGLTEAGTRGWASSLVVGALSVSGVLLLALLVVEWRTYNPVLDVRIFRYGAFSRAIVLIWIVTGFYYGSLFLIPFFFQNVEGLSALTSGEILIGQGAAAAIGIAIGGELYPKIGPRILGTAGMLSLAVSTIGFTHLDVNTTGLSLQVWLLLRGLGLGLTTTPLQNLALSVVDRRDLARGTSLVNITRQVSSAAGVAALTAYVSQQVANHASVAMAALHSVAPTRIAAGCASHPAQAAACISRHATAAGLNDAFSVSLVACSLAVALALLVGRDPGLEALKGEAMTQVGEAFPDLPHDVAVEVASRARPQRFEPGQLILRQGDHPDQFYVITDGNVQVTQRTDAGGQVALRTLGPGQYFGEIGLLANLPRTASVTAVTAVELLGINEATFRDLLSRSAETAGVVRAAMDERLAILP